ncbi:protein cereblon-like [Ctenocephalides felis]|uniref:protein cereblon-like n=1 Tax=Ctenocephalides felis TaxID=7515 RepID=UPI000E6E526C|nr:protein cereblon-like [Ctenocephalides felis]
MSDNDNENDSDDVFDPSLSDSDQREVIIIERLHFSPIISSDSEDSIDSIDEQDIQVINLETNNDSDEEMVDYNRDLPGEHTYLGTDMLPVSGCLVLEQNSVYELPLLAHHSLIFPNQILPMMPHIMHASRLSKEIEGSHVFGLVCPNETGKEMFEYGIICEIFEKEPDHDTDIVRVKARGRQRFRVLGPMKGLRDYLSIVSQQVMILPEYALTDPLSCAHLSSLDKYRLQVSSKNMSAAAKKRHTYLTCWPMFVFNQYDLGDIVEKIRKYFRQLNIDSFPNDPIALSFWVAHNLQLDTATRLLLFKLDSALHRLQIELKYLEKSDSLCCKNCQSKIAKTSDLFAMSNDGIQSHYCNPEGWIHETFTVMRASEVRLHGHKSTRASWFPGYAWTIALCKSCNQHVGWQFTATEKNLRPSKFWGLCRTSITQKICMEDDI